MIRTMRRGAKKVEKRKQRENPRTFAVLGFMSADFNLDIYNPRDLAFRPAALLCHTSVLPQAKP